MPKAGKPRVVDLGPLRALRDEEPATLMMQVRKAWPDIEAARAAGHSLKVIHKRLTQGGLGISYRTLVTCISRIAWEDASRRGPL